MPGTKLIRPALPFLAAAMLEACSGVQPIDALGGPSLAVTSAVSTLVLIATDKTIVDHVATGITGEDCSLVAYMADGHYCRPGPEPVELTREPLYCYRTLADVECYLSPNPFGGNPPAVGTRFSREVARPASEGPTESAARAVFR